jgi:hypothetical protein
LLDLFQSWICWFYPLLLHQIQLFYPYYILLNFLRLNFNPDRQFQKFKSCRNKPKKPLFSILRPFYNPELYNFPSWKIFFFLDPSPQNELRTIPYANFKAGRCDVKTPFPILSSSFVELV